MPELPEVETVRRGLEPVLTGERILRVEQRRADLRFPFPADFACRIEGFRVVRLDRRAKYLLAHLDSGEVLVMHLGMSGRFLVQPAPGAGRSGKPTKVDGRQQLAEFVHEVGHHPHHDHVVFHIGSGAVVTYNDVRRFGYMTLIGETELATHPLLKNLGIEPLGNALNAPYLAELAAGRRTDLKAFLLDQRNIAGLGNIYVCEALFRAKLAPSRPASVLALKSGRPSTGAERLVPAIRDVLNEAIAAGGSTLRDYAHTDGSLGYFQHAFQAYGREAEPCLRPGCNGRIARMVQAGRSTFYCSRCQR